MPEIEIEGILRDLSHLNDFTVNLAKKGKDGADLRVSVRLGLHTISRACNAEEEGNMLDENGRPRVFCEERYSFSLGLKEIVTRMITQKYFCWESRDRNRVVNYAVLDAAPGRIGNLKDGQHTVIYFYLYPANGVKADVIMHVLSCHMRELSFKKIKRRFDMHNILRTCLFQNKRVP